MSDGKIGEDSDDVDGHLNIAAMERKPQRRQEIYSTSTV